MKNTFRGFPPGTLEFLRRLSRNNRREWFKAHKKEFEAHVRTPMTEFVLAVGGAMQTFAPEMITDPRKAIYRIYRDTRFSPDKTPYKTHTAAVFVPRGIPKHGGASLYFHVSPEELLIAGGVYMPGSRELLAIRRHISRNWKELQSILRAREFERTFKDGLEGETLVRAPKGFPPDHPAIDLLRHKQFLVHVSEPPEFAESPRLMPRVLQVFTAQMPLLRFLNAALSRR